jgi:hypothetical protein
MKHFYSILWAVMAISPIQAANLTGQTIQVTYLFPNTSTIFTTSVKHTMPAVAINLNPATSYAGFDPSRLTFNRR